MGKGKPHLEFESLSMDEGWEVPPGYPEGMEQKVLTTDLDEDG
ncbi:MAG: cupin, partial [Rhodospirillaceae bacterium]|nr:cupin [Rhodospirillaceae bacterium]